MIWEDVGIGACGCGDERMLFRKQGDDIAYCAPCTTWRDRHGNKPRQKPVEPTGPSKNCLRAMRFAARYEQIRELWATGDIKKTEIAAKLVCSLSTVYQALHGPRGKK